MRDLDNFNAQRIDERSEQEANELMDDELYKKLQNGDIPKMPPLQKIDPKTGKIQEVK
jgi:hypothetical protein